MIEIQIDHEALLIILLVLFLLRWFIDWRGGKAMHKKNDKLIEDALEHRDYVRDMLGEIYQQTRTDKKGADAE